MRVVRIRCNIVAVSSDLFRPVGRRVDVAGAAHLVLAQGVAQLDPARAVFDGMLAGWCAQQRSRMLNELTIGGRERLVRRFAEFTNEYPWTLAGAGC